MNSDRNIAIVIGVLFLVAAVASIFGVVLYAPILNDHKYVIDGNSHVQVAWGAVFEIITAFAVIGTSVTLYPILKRYNERMALAAVCFRLAEATVIIIGILCLLTIVTLNVRLGGEEIADPYVYTALGKLLIDFHNWTFLYGPNILLGPSTLMTAYVLRRMNMVPRVVSMLGLIGGPTIFLCGVLVTLGLFDQVSVWGVLMAVPVFSYEMSLAIFLVAKGFKESEELSVTTPVQNLFRLAGSTVNK